jgi:hypothetical protein
MSYSEDWVWHEDQLEGRYHVVLDIDTGAAGSIQRIYSELEAFANTLPGLGYQLEVRSILAGEKRKAL